MPRCMQTLTSLKDMLCQGVCKETCYAKMYADIDITKGNMLCQGVCKETCYAKMYADIDITKGHVMPRCM